MTTSPPEPPSYATGVPVPGGGAPPGRASWPHQVYTAGYEPAFLEHQSKRTAAANAGFLLPHLSPGMRLLDCGCGLGSITVGLAEVVAPGEVVGIDVERQVLDMAQRSLGERGLGNISFAVADVYHLPFPDASFDAAFAHTLLVHLREPRRALEEIRRVLKPGGVAGVSDPDFGTHVRTPSTPLLDQLGALLIRAMEQKGGSPMYARHQRRLLLEAGFARAEASARAVARGTPEVTRSAPDRIIGRLRPTILEQGWADEETLDAMAEELRAWGERPDSFSAFLFCEAVGWVGAEPP